MRNHSRTPTQTQPTPTPKPETVDLRFEERPVTPVTFVPFPSADIFTKATNATRQFYSPSVSLSEFAFVCVSVLFVHFLHEKNNEKKTKTKKTKTKTTNSQKHRLRSSYTASYTQL